MKPGMRTAQAALEDLLESNELTRGMYVRVHGENLILGREENLGRSDPVDRVDCVRLTRLSKGTWGLSVRRHTGRWEQTPFSGTMKDVVRAIWTFMQHLVAAW